MRKLRLSTKFQPQEMRCNYDILLSFHSRSHYKSFHFHQYFYCILLVIHQLSLFYIYNFYNLSILLCCMIYPYSQLQLLGFQANPLTFILYLLYIHSYTYLHSIFVYYYKHLHLIYICVYKFHAILCVLFDY